MARKPATPAQEPKPATEPRRRAVEALLRLAAQRDWDRIELTDIAGEAGLTLAELRGLFPSKGAMLGGLMRLVDDDVLAGTSADLAGEPIRERLFDLVMRRLDAMAPYKPGLRRIVPALKRQPLALAALNQAALNSWRYLLASVDVPTEDSLGNVRIQGAALLMARVLETWLDDDEPELARTMARLDRELTTAGRIMGRVEDVHRLTSPFRGLLRALCEGRRPVRRRARGEENDDYAPAI